MNTRDATHLRIIFFLGITMIRKHIYKLEKGILGEMINKEYEIIRKRRFF